LIAFHKTKSLGGKIQLLIYFRQKFPNVIAKQHLLSREAWKQLFFQKGKLIFGAPGGIRTRVSGFLPFEATKGRNT